MHVTATNRLARELEWAHDRHQMEQGARSWRSLPVMPYSAWLVRLWKDWVVSNPSGIGPRLLAPPSERIVWERMIRSVGIGGGAGAVPDSAGTATFDVPSMARAAMEAWSVLHEWEIPMEEDAEAALSWRDTPDTEVFLEWTRRFRRRLARRRWITHAELPRFVAGRIRAGEIVIPERVEFHGFLERTPARSRIAHALEVSGVATVENDPSASCSGRAEDSGPRTVRARDEEDEVRLVAAWARREFESRPLPPNADVGDPVRIGVVVPEFEQYRSRIERIFGETFHPDTWTDPESDSRRVFNLSLGSELGHQPPVVAAMRLLRAHPGRIPLETVGEILRSPFLRSARTESAARAEIDAEVRRLREPEISAEGVLRAAGRRIRSCPELIRALRAWSKAFPGDRREFPSRWAEIFSSILEAVGWPGDSVSSMVYQTVHAWEELIRDFAGMDAAAGPIAWSAAGRILETMVSERQFQPKSERAPIQVLGLLEAQGMQFDRLWVMGLHDGAWPRSANPNPFIPVALQRQVGVRGASPEIELNRARAIEAVFLRSAPVIRISFPSVSGDVERRPSRFAAGFRVLERDWFPDPEPTTAERLSLSANPEFIRDDVGPRWTSDDVRGGVSVLKDQAACPFRAFAVHRLGAIPLERGEAGLDARDRGELVHRALQAIWSELRSHEDLTSLLPAERRQVVVRAVGSAIEALASSKAVLAGKRFVEVERARLERLLGEWLDLERRRAPFSLTVNEGRGVAVIGGLRFHVRPDRVDRLEDGSLVLVDYKTGAQGPSRWFGERPDEPQLPFYAVALSDHSPVHGVYFGTIRPGQVAFRGIGDSTDIAPGTELPDRTMSDTVDAWKRVLATLAGEFVRGEARVDPKTADACRHCALEGLCRVDDLAAVGHRHGGRL